MMNGCPRWSFLTVPLLAALGCSDPVPRPAQGNLNLSVQQGTGCPVTAKVYQVGNPKPPSTISSGDKLIDGENGATIKCAVHGGGPYTFSGTIQGRSSENDRVYMTMTGGVINADKISGTVTVAINTPQLSNTYTSDAGTCIVTVVNSNVKGGSLWATVSCAKVSEPSTATSCSVGPTTTFVLENCDGS